MLDPRIFICIPVFNRLPFTINCINSLLNQTYQNFHIIICDDGSKDGTSEYLSTNFPSITLLYGNGDLWWAGGTNKCIEYALTVCRSGDFIFTMNNDSYIYPNLLRDLIYESQRNPKAILGCVNVTNSDLNLIEPSAFKEQNTFFFPKLLRAINKWNENLDNIKFDFDNVDSLSGKGCLILIDVFKEIGLYNSKKLPHYYADTEFTYRAKKKGFSILIFYKHRIVSFTEESGLGQLNSSPNFKDFLRGFINIKSSHHLKSVYYFSKLAYGDFYVFYFIYTIVGIIFDYFRFAFFYYYGKNK